MYCPNCRSEFVPGVTTCPECDVPLVNALDPLPEEPGTRRLVALVTTYSPGDVAIVSAFLESRGIPFFLKNDVVDRIYLQIAPVLVMVHEDDLAAGVEALKDLDPRFTRDWEKAPSGQEDEST